jgi:hypothetical protein
MTAQPDILRLFYPHIYKKARSALLFYKFYKFRLRNAL